MRSTLSIFAANWEAIAPSTGALKAFEAAVHYEARDLLFMQ